MIKVWPIIENISSQLPSDTTKLLQQRIDFVYTFGGDGTLLALLQALYLHYDCEEIPKIAAFNMVSFFLNFKPLFRGRWVIFATLRSKSIDKL